MIPNRTVSITGIFAADASTIIPATPVAGQSYRDETMTGTVVREGWAFKTIVDSSKFNQAMYEYSSVTSQIEKYGFLPWSNLTDYVAGSVCLGSNGTIYQAQQETGPSTTAYDPTNSSGIWTPVTLGVSEFLFHHVWSEYILNRLDWLRADTFSWQNGVTYSNAYNHLVDDYTNGTSTTETVGSYTITYYQAQDGHKICLPDQEATVNNIYNESGVAWYYILDTTNQRFKLPRTKYGFVGLRDAVGKYVPESLPNHMHYVSRSADISKESVESEDGGSHDTVSRNANLNTSYLAPTTLASYNNSVYQDNAPVQERATQMYLYFYVGQFTQTATEQTAGLNSELFNGKVDLNAANLSAQGKSLISGFGMPSDRYEDLTLGASNSYYTAPANGYFFIGKTAGANNGWLDCQITNGTTTLIGTSAFKAYSGDQILLFLPALKGQILRVTYGARGTVNNFRFIYAKGEENV